MSTAQPNETMNKVLGFITNALLVIVMAWAGWQQTTINKLDERIYALQATAVTDQKMEAMEQRITSYVDKSITGLSSQMAVTNKYLEILTERSYKGKD